MAYPFQQIEQKWQKFWEQNKIFKTSNVIDYSKPKYYVLDMFPYPSGAGLHVGHPEGYTATDIIARYKRMKGFNVLHPMGWDAFGLPAEQYAIETGTHPRITTEKNIDRFRNQLKSIGFSYDWNRQVDTTDPNYYRWTQWIFLQLYKRGLAYLAEVPVNWCPELGTVLANEEIIDGKSERGGHPVYKRPMKQWMLRITEYADRLLEDLDQLDWPESTKEMQRNWIGRSVGAEVEFPVVSNKEMKISVYTTRPDTLFGSTYMVLSPEHPLVYEITAASQMERVRKYCENAEQKTDLERTDLQKVKTGVFSGGYAVNPTTGEHIPIWIADYVLISYGTGAIMAVPAHDQRDYEFAKTYHLPIRQVISGGDIAESAYEGDGTLINSTSGFFSIDGLTVTEAKEAITVWLEEQGIGRRKINYKLRDWLFSRQRYWGEPFPILHDDAGNTFAVNEDELPVLLPEMEDFRPTPTEISDSEPQPPLSRAPRNWIEVTEAEKILRRELNTMPQWAGSCWYYLRFIDPRNAEKLVDPELETYWMPVDLYVGGAEHSVLHLLYARFWHKVLYDIGVVSTKEPFEKLVHQGMILGPLEYTLYRDENNQPVSAEFVSADGIHIRSRIKLRSEKLTEDQVVKDGENYLWQENQSVKVDARAYKMSKSRGNVVNPDDIIKNYGADSLRLYEMFMGPLKDMKSWSMHGVDGVHRFLNRVWRLIVDEDSGKLAREITDKEPNREQLRQLHQTIQKVTHDLETMQFNTAIAAMMVLVNEANKWADRPRSILYDFLRLLNPFAPHITEELWSRLGKKGTLSFEIWPELNPKYLEVDEKEIVIQINGKLRGSMNIPTDKIGDKSFLEAAALSQPKIKSRLEGTTVRNVIIVPGKLVNIVAG